MQVVEYQPHFWSNIIYQPQILGADPDHSQYYTWLRSGVFSFTSIQRFSNQFHKIPYDMIDQFLLYVTFDEIIVTLQTSYNGEKYKVEFKVTNDIIISRDRNKIIEFIFDIMYKLVQATKMELYKKSHYKEELDTLRTAQHNILISASGIASDQFDYIRKRIDKLDKEMNFEFERKIMFVEDRKSVTQSLRDFTAETPLEALPEKSEEETFQEIEDRLNRTAKTLKLNRIAVKNLPKSISDKFILPLDASVEADFERFKGLISQPFSFLDYNGAKFSINLKLKKMKGSFIEKNQTSLIEYLRQFQNIKTDLERKEKYDKERIKKLKNVFKALEEHITQLKSDFEAKNKKFGNQSYLQFVGSRTINNIKKLREAQEMLNKKISVLENKKFYTDKKQFFKRMLKLYLGESGTDILNDLKNIGQTNKEVSEIGIVYFLFLLSIIEGNKGYNSPVLPIIDQNDFDKGYTNTDVLRIMAGHMFIHTISISNN